MHHRLQYEPFFFDSERILDAQIADVNPSNSIEDGKDDMFSF
jgi:hypothetical protein